jgi:hypothetical protein
VPDFNAMHLPAGTEMKCKLRSKSCCICLWFLQKVRQSHLAKLKGTYVGQAALHTNLRNGAVCNIPVAGSFCEKQNPLVV